MFGWLSGKSKSNLPEPTALQAQRAKQIDQLKTFNQNVSEIHRDVEYRVNTVVNNTTISLYISLPPQFPQEKPMVKVSPRVSHPWINDQMLVTGSPGINSFMVHSDLGKVIREITDEFLRNPPTPLGPTHGYGAYPPPYGVSPSVGSAPTAAPVASLPQPAGFPYPPQTTTHQQPSIPSYISQLPVSLPQPGPGTSLPTMPPPVNTFTSGLAEDPTSYWSSPSQAQVQSSVLGGYRMPEMPVSIPQLSDLSMQELKELLNDEDVLLQRIGQLPQVQQLTVDREMLTEQNEELAKQNLSSKPVLEERKRSLLEKYDLFNDIKQQYDQNSHRQDGLRQKYDPRHIQDNLKVAALQAEEESEVIAEKFLDGKMAADDFKKYYMDKRKLSHLRRAKEERLTHLIMTNPGRPGF